MGGFSVRPEVLATAGASVARTAAEAGGAASAVRAALSAIGSAAAHPGVASAAEDAGAKWRGAVQAWALGGDHLGTSLVGAATSYLQVDAQQVQGGPTP
jgi:hypothetical protein